MDDHNRPPADVFAEDLTWREQEVLVLLAERMTNREIGDRLHLTENTVKAYVGNILGKLYVKNRRQAVERAKELGLFGPDTEILSRAPHNLPADPTPFIGREDLLAEIHRLLSINRLLTLIGPGGIGKTRLALQAAADMLGEFEHGVFLVTLAPIRSAEHVVQAVAEAIGFPLSTEENPIDQLLVYLRRRQLLLVMDNFEHLLAGADVVGELLLGAPDVKVLATSREKLNLQSETALSIAGMDFPDWETSVDLLAYDAIQLFLQCVHRVHPGFEPGPSDLRHLVHISQMVLGMPLAIELAAAWMDILSPGEIADEIQKGLDILTTEMRDVPERHRSIRAVFDHSWSLMDQTEREVFMHLSVFRGGFTREAAQQVAAASLQSLSRLANKSFLRHDPDSGRFEIHELLRQYAQERLEESPEASASAHEAHAGYYAQFMQERWQHLKDHRQKLALTEIDADIENIRTAWRYRVDQRDVAQMQMFVNSFWLVYWVRGWNHAAVELFREAAEVLRGEHGEEAEALRALALAHQGYFMALLGLSEQGYELAEEGAAVLEGLERFEELTLAGASLSLNLYSLNRPVDEHLEVSSKMLESATSIDDRWLSAYALYPLSLIAFQHQDYAEARQLAESGLAIYEELGNPAGSAMHLLVRGHAAMALGEYVEARDFYLRCLRASEELDFHWVAEKSYKYLGQVALSMDEIAEAEARFLESLRIAEEIGLGRDMVNLLYEFARVRAAEGCFKQAVELLALVIKHPNSLQHRLGRGRIRDSAQRQLATLEAELSPEIYTAALERGQALELDSVVTEILEGKDRT